eukprot:PRCOL_00002265-RA
MGHGEGAGGDAGAPASAVPAGDQRPSRVLLVDAEGAARDELHGLLRSCSYASVPVSTADEAVIFLASGVNFEIMLCSTALGQDCVFDLIRRVRAMDNHKGLAIVVIGTTEGVNVAEVTAALDAGACEFLSKPLVRSVVSNLWTHAWRKQREVAKDEGGARAGLGAAGPAAGAPTGNGAPPANDDSENTHEDAAAGATAAAGNAAARGTKLAVSS